MSATNYHPTNVTSQKSEGLNTTLIVCLNVIYFQYFGSAIFFLSGLNLTSLFLIYVTGLYELHMLRAAIFSYALELRM